MKYAYWLHNVPRIGNIKIQQLLLETNGAEEIYGLDSHQLKKIGRLTEADVKAIEESKQKWDVDKEWFKLIEQGIGFVSLEQNEFPEKVRHISNPPYALYKRYLFIVVSACHKAYIGTISRAQRYVIKCRKP